MGNFLLENEQGEAITVNGDRYGAMLNEICAQKFKRRILTTYGFNKMALRATQPKLLFDVMLPVLEDRIISRRTNVVWPPRSCDLTSLDDYLWGAVKDKCYADKPDTLRGQYS